MFSKDKDRKCRQLGFSMVELLIVVVIILVIAAMAAPQIFTFVNNYRLKSSASKLAGFIQQCRVNAVRSNSVAGVQANGNQLYLDLNNDTNPDTGEPVMVLPQQVTLQTAGFPGDAKATLGTATWQIGAPVRFNARGIPCRNASCDTVAGSVGFVYYLRLDRGNGNYSWAAVRVNPVGRITTVMWSGSSYQ